MIVDAHQHFWNIERGDYGWLQPGMPALYRDFLPEDLRPLLRTVGVDRTVLVQAAPTEAETEFLLQLAAETDFVAGVVGWIDIDDDTFPSRLEHFRRHPKFVGVRPMLQDLEDDAYILRPRVLDHLRLLAELDFPIDFLTLPQHLGNVARALEQVPGLPAVVDHLSKPPIASGEVDPWRDLMAAIAAFPNVSCKVSGMVTEADYIHWQPEHLKPYVDHMVDCFGQERLLFGSDWPVALQAASYQRVYETARTLLAARLDEKGMEAVFGGNAVRFYRLG